MCRMGGIIKAVYICRDIYTNPSQIVHQTKHIL